MRISIRVECTLVIYETQVLYLFFFATYTSNIYTMKKKIYVHNITSYNYSNNNKSNEQLPRKAYNLPLLRVLLGTCITFIYICTFQTREVKSETQRSKHKIFIVAPLFIFEITTRWNKLMKKEQYGTMYDVLLTICANFNISWCDTAREPHFL